MGFAFRSPPWATGSWWDGTDEDAEAQAAANLPEWDYVPTFGPLPAATVPAPAPKPKPKPTPAPALAAYRPPSSSGPGLGVWLLLGAAGLGAVYLYRRA